VHDEDAPPGIDLLESMRSVGYSLEAALADLIDNSISASAHNIEIDLEPVEAAHVAIIDDGVGMGPERAFEALRLAGAVGERSQNDLGRFGLGLKTASLSQARALTVVTRQDGVETALRWDIDHVHKTGRWTLQRLSVDDATELFWVDRLRECESGTLVLWQNLDLLLGDAPDPGAHLRERVAPLVSALGLTFHRYLHGRAGGIHLRVNGNDVRPVDPFLSTNPATQASPTEYLRVGGDVVAVTAFTLPHVSKLTSAERQRPDLGERMRDAQGFYIYRNRRLISHGHWYGLTRSDDLSKQTRVQVDVPNTIDHLWHLDIKKSRAEPPASFKTELRRLLGPVIDKGRRVYRYRGRKEGPTELVHMWSKIRDRDVVRYEVNYEHPLVTATIAELDTSAAVRVSQLLRTVAWTFPFDDVYQEMASNVAVARSDADRESTIEDLRALRDSLGVRVDAESAFRMLMHAEPYAGIPDLRSMVLGVWRGDEHVERD